MAEILLDCLTRSTVLKPNVDKYKKKYKGRKKKYYRLLTIMDRYLKNEKLKEHGRENLDARIERIRQPTAVATSNCPYWLRGYCTKGKSCLLIRDPLLKGNVKDATPMTPAAPAPSTAATPEGGTERPTHSGGERGREKGNGKGNSEGKDKQPEIPNPRDLRADFQVDACERQNCPFTRELGTAEEQKNLEKLRGIVSESRSRSASPTNRREPCFQWQKTGTRNKGDSCQCAHDGAQPNPKGKSKKGSA